MGLTEHVALLILPSLLARNIPLEPKPYHGGILHRVLPHVQSSDHAEATAVIQILGQALKFRPKFWKREVVRANIISIQLQR